MEKQPHEPNSNPFVDMERCGAKTRQRTPCRRIGTKRNGRCRLHGGAKGVGAPKGNQNALKHGYYTKEAIEKRKRIRALINDSISLIEQVNNR